MDEYEYCRLSDRGDGELHVGYFERNPAAPSTGHPRLIRPFHLRRSADPAVDQTPEAIRRLEHEGWIPAGEIPAGDADGAFQRYYQRLTR